MPAVGQILIPRQVSGLRDGQWLGRELERIWASCFDDTPRVNVVQVRFAGGWKNRLGVISLSEDRRTSYVGINALLSLPEVPDCIARITIAHELVHYAHGFGSPLPRLYRHPHRGRIVEKELKARGLRQEYLVYQEWIHSHWYDFYERSALNPAFLAAEPVDGDLHETYESQ